MPRVVSAACIPMDSDTTWNLLWSLQLFLFILLVVLVLQLLWHFIGLFCMMEEEKEEAPVPEAVEDSEKATVTSNTHSFKVRDDRWTVPTWYRNFSFLVADVSSVLCNAEDKRKEPATTVTVKKLYHPFHTENRAKAAFRELILLRGLRHENIISLLDVFSPDTSEEMFDELYIVTPRHPYNLHGLIQSEPQAITSKMIAFVTYQVLCALKYLHSGGVMHRDLKPSSIFLDDNAVVKVSDFGLSRDVDIGGEMTGYVTTRCYRAPEVFTHWTKYSETADLWSLGCIVAEMVLKAPLFPARDFVEHLLLVMKLVGSPRDRHLAEMTIDAKWVIAELLPKCPKKSIRSVAGLEKINGVLADFLDCVLVLDSRYRFTAAEALGHALVREFHDPDAEPVAGNLECVQRLKQLEGPSREEPWSELARLEVISWQ